jgi:hypothetical protein
MVWLILSITFSGITYGKQVVGFDVITMKNGDIHNGTIAREIFTLETPYGNVSIPYGLMATLRIGKANELDRILTRTGWPFRLCDSRSFWQGRLYYLGIDLSGRARLAQCRPGLFTLSSR